MGEPAKAGKGQPGAPGGNPANRAVFVIIGVIAIAVIAVVFILYKPDFSRSENNSGYVILFQNLELTDAANVVESLKSQGVKDYKLQNDGRTILVPGKKKSQIALNIAKEGVLPTGGTVGFEIFDKGGQLGATDFDKQVKFSRAISGELSRSISRIYGVEEARVQVVIPAKQLFETQQNPVLASVFVKIKEGELLSPLQVSGIISLVASSVEGLMKENVTVVDYYGRVLSSEEYTRDYEKLLALMMTQKDEAQKSRKEVLASITEEVVQPATGAKGGIFDIYKKIDREKKERQEQNLMKKIGIRKGMSSEDLYAAKLKFKEKYEDMLEQNINVIAEQFFPKKAVKVKVNVELNNVKISETASPNSLISRITTMILLDENNKEIILTPEIKEALMKAVAAAIGYIKGRDRIDLRWAPMVNMYKKKISVDIGGLKEKVNIPNLQDKDLQGTVKKAVTFSWLKGDSVYYLFGALGTILLLFFISSFLKKRRPIIPETGVGQHSMFEEGKSDKGFEDLKMPVMDQIREIANKAPERVAAILEKWFMEDESKK